MRAVPFLILCFISTYLAIPTLPTKNVFIGVKFIHFRNFESTIATGQCCDKPNLTAGSCTPNLCDTAFIPCGTSNPSNPCAVIKDTKTPSMYNTDSFEFPEKLGNADNHVSRFLSASVQFTPRPITVTVKAVETPEFGQTGMDKDIANFQFVIDWLDPIFNTPPLFRRFVLNDTRGQLVLDVLSQCNLNYYSADCSVYCEEQPGNYTCLQDVLTSTSFKALTISTTVPTVLATKATSTKVNPFVTLSKATTLQISQKSRHLNQNYSSTPTGSNGREKVDKTTNIAIWTSIGALSILVVLGGMFSMIKIKKRKSQVTAVDKQTIN